MAKLFNPTLGVVAIARHFVGDEVVWLLRYPNCDPATEADARFVEREIVTKGLSFQKWTTLDGAEYIHGQGNSPEEEYLSDLLTWVRNGNEVFSEEIYQEVLDEQNMQSHS